MHEERLTLLEQLLIKDANEPTGAMFDLGMWIGHEDPSWRGNEVKFDPLDLGIPEIDPSAYGRATAEDHAVPTANLPKMTCGTKGCALGLAMLSGQFEKWGLKAGYFISGDGKTVQLLPTCNGEDGFEAGAALFDISTEDSRYLFDPDCYSETPQGAKGELFVAQRIHDFINGEIDENYHPDYHDQDDDCGED